MILCVWHEHLLLDDGQRVAELAGSPGHGRIDACMQYMTFLFLFFFFLPESNRIPQPLK